MSNDPVEMLKEIAHRYHHFKQENKHKGPVSSRNRQHQQVLRQLERDFESVVDRWVRDDRLHDAWLAHFYHFAPAPRGPLMPKPPLFRGRDRAGRSAELIPAEDSYELIIEGKPVQRLARVRLPGRRLRALNVSGDEFEETFAASAEARAALREYTENPERGAPWQHLGDLYSDGIVDPNFALTSRGRRFMDTQRNGNGGVELLLG